MTPQRHPPPQSSKKKESYGNVSETKFSLASNTDDGVQDSVLSFRLYHPTTPSFLNPSSSRH